MQAEAAGEQRNSLKVAADIGPLRRSMYFFARKKNGNRSAEKLVVPGILAIARGLVVARYIDRPIEQFADRKTPRPIGFAQRLGINRVVGALAFRQLSCHSRCQQRLELFDAFARRRRARRALDDIADYFFRDRRGKEGAARIS